MFVLVLSTRVEHVSKNTFWAQVVMLAPHRDLIKCGVNIPPCLIYNDDEGLSVMSEKLLGQNFIQFICKNILHVHARRHPNKRLYVMGEDNPHSFIDKKNPNFQKLLN